MLGGTQSLHTNSFDEAFAIPSEEAIKVAVRTQQILLHETGVADVVDPLAGSYYVESLTTQIEEEALDLIRASTHGRHGGRGQHRLRQPDHRRLVVGAEGGDRVGPAHIVGLNDYVDDGPAHIGGIELFKPDPGVHERQLKRLAEVKRVRDERRVTERAARDRGRGPRPQDEPHAA